MCGNCDLGQGGKEKEMNHNTEMELQHVVTNTMSTVHLRNLYFVARSFACLSLPAARRADSRLWRDGEVWLGGAQSNHLFNMAS